MNLTQAYALLNSVQFAAWYVPRDRTGKECLPIAIEVLENIGRALDAPEFAVNDYMRQVQRIKDSL